MYTRTTFIERPCAKELYHAQVCDARGNSLKHPEFAPLLSSWGNPPLATQLDQLQQALGLDGATDGG